MADTLHTVEITGNPDDPATWRIKFTCHGDRDAECHQYPDCYCEVWDSDHEEEQGHPLVPHDQCWMRDWFDNDCTDPYSETLPDCDYAAGMSGPVKARFEEDSYVAWEFITEGACPHDSRSGAGGRWRCDECGADCGPDTYLAATTAEADRG